MTARPVVEALERRRIDPDQALRAASITREALAQIENRLPAANVAELWEAGAIAARDRSFGLHVAEEVPEGSFDLIEYVFATSENLGEGLRRVTEYMPLVEEPSPIRLEIGPTVTIMVRRMAIDAPQYDEFSFALLLVRSRRATGVTWKPQRMQFHHRRRDDDGDAARVFRCPIKWGARRTELRFRRALLGLPMMRRDSRLLAILERYAASLLPRTGEHSLTARTAHAIALDLARKRPAVGPTARALRMSPRTLQRNLAFEGTSHSMLVDDVRRALALQHIGDASVSITELAYMLHFSDPAAFYRAFKRWTGTSPRTYRERLLHGR
ncbi:MAG TPA: AraC family transcriptional regulator [Kofleriaceae bacterium]|nr:AraC family transcriptional regulator [Kofleriaceae bacterium]